MTTSASLTSRDRAVLESVFNPELPFNVEDTASSHSQADQELEDSSNRLSDPVCQLEVKAIEAAENGNLNEALLLLDQCLTIEPNRCSVYNDRAQVHRLMGNVEEAKTDLEKAILLSEGQGQIACKAFTQRAMIKRFQGDEEGCRQDFKAAADLGSQFAKKELVALNPYAAMCNAMLSEMITKLKEGQPTDSGDPAA